METTTTSFTTNQSLQSLIDTMGGGTTQVKCTVEKKQKAGGSVAEMEMVLWINELKTLRLETVYTNTHDTDQSVIDKMSTLMIRTWLSHGIKDIYASTVNINELVDQRLKRENNESNIRIFTNKKS
ncbi:MAG TPA: hypothetical protein VGB67_10270 [Fibrella sp.]|jgi:hypothetical protein